MNLTGQVKTGLAVLVVFGLLLAANNFFMESVVQWILFSDSVVLFFSAASVYITKAAVRGTFYAVNADDTFSLLIYAVLLIA